LSGLYLVPEPFLRNEIALSVVDGEFSIAIIDERFVVELFRFGDSLNESY
jgi:hypothetical protein